MFPFSISAALIFIYLFIYLLIIYLLTVRWAVPIKIWTHKLNHVIFFISKPGKKKFLLFQFQVFRRTDFSHSRHVKYAAALYLHIHCISYIQHKHKPDGLRFPIEMSECSTLVDNHIFCEHNVMQHVFMHYIYLPVHLFIRTYTYVLVFSTLLSLSPKFKHFILLVLPFSFLLGGLTMFSVSNNN